MISAIDEVNNLTDVLIDDLEEKRKNSPKTLEAVQKALNRAEHRIVEVRKVLGVYKDKYPPSDVWIEPTPEQIKALLAD